MSRWELDFDFYLARIEDKPASFVVDLSAEAHAPVATHPLQLTIRVPMLRPRPDGLRDASELEDLGDLEDQFVEALAEKLDAIYVGRVVHDGNTLLFLYVPEEHRDALDELPALTGDPPGDYEPSWGVSDDPDWVQYSEFLAPDEYARQSIWNRRLVNIFGEKGDQLDQPREIDHLAYFPSREAAEQAAAALTAAGFRCDPITEPGEEQDEGDDAELGDEAADADETAEADEALAEAIASANAQAAAEGEDDEDDEDEDDEDESDEDESDEDESDEEDENDERWGLQFHRDDALADGRPDEFVGEILDIILPLDGAYDGWGAEHRPAAS